jgi:hypothetical protein
MFLGQHQLLACFMVSTTLVVTYRVHQGYEGWQVCR